MQFGYDQLCQQHKQVHLLFQKYLLCSVCTNPATFLHLDNSLRCPHCVSIKDHSLRLDQIDLNPEEIMKYLGVHLDRQKAIVLVQRQIDDKIDELKTYRKNVIGHLESLSMPEQCKDILVLQLEGKREVTKGSMESGFKKIKQSWVMLNKALDTKSGAFLVNEIIDQVESKMKQITFRYQPITSQIKPFSCHLLSTLELNDKPKAIVAIQSDHWFIGCKNKLVEIQNGKKLDICIGLNVWALAVMPDGIVVGCDNRQKCLFRVNLDRSISMISNAKFKQNCFSIFVRTNGDILYTDTQNNSIRQTRLDSTKSTVFFQANHQISLFRPTAIVQYQDSFIVCHKENQIVSIKDGHAMTINGVVGQKFADLCGVTLGHGKMLVCDKGIKAIFQIWSQKGKLNGRELKIKIQGLDPRNVGLDFNTNQLLVTDRNNRKIHILQIHAQ